MTLEEKCEALEKRLSTVESREVLSREDAKKLLDDRLKDWVIFVAKVLGIPSLVVVVGCLIYVFAILPHQAASMALASSGKLQEDIRKVTKDIAVQEHELKQIEKRVAAHSTETNEQLEVLASRIKTETGKVSQLEGLLAARDVKLRENLLDLENRLGDVAQDIDIQVGLYNQRLSLIDQQIGTFESIIDKFSGDQGKLLLNRMDKFSKFLESDEGVRSFETLASELATVKNGTFTRIECQSLSVISGTDSPSGKVQLTIGKNGAGQVDTYNAAGKRLCSMGESTNGNGGFWAYHKDQVTGKAPNIGLQVDDEGGGKVMTYNAAGKLLCMMGESKNGNGGFWAYHKDHVTGNKANLRLRVDDDGGGQVGTYNAAGKRLCSMGESTGGNGGFWTFDKDGKQTRSMP